ncbi:coagulation factor 5/8 type-like protein [Kribbella turkmenica]|uniref:Coagulation factor 5/8 type-like protein n=1 Tax=Kribbella turkmenica TaxID=2530375 RepID=A0A4R4X799_9ACTN|nr:M36 family metallopeptidase [Kribbella turkmenica]TDD26331.1 coagulation factor 5/8 type-like protein [Kribbella turkmenica]
MRNPLVVRSLALLAAGSALIGAFGATTGAQALVDPSPAGVVADSRVASLVRPTTSQVDAVAAILAGAGAGARVTWDPRYGTPRTIRPDVGEALSGPRPGSAVDVARAWLTENRAVLGLSAADIAAMAVRRDHSLPGTGSRVVNLTQTFGGIPAARGGSVGVLVAADGRVLSYTGSTSRSNALVGSFDLSPQVALTKVAAALAPQVKYEPSLTGASQAGYQVVARGPFAANSYLRKTTFGTAEGGRAAYQVLFVKAQDEAYDVLVDARSGEVLYRRSLVQHEGPLDPEGTVYRNYPGAPAGGTPERVSFGRTPESPNGWVDPLGLTGTGVTTFGNNANAHANWSNFIGPIDPGPRPADPQGKFNYVFTDQWGEQQCAVPSYSHDIDPSATNLFYHHNRIHDEYYDLGFTESAGNFQIDNFGKGGLGGDAIQGLAQAGAVSGGAPTYTGRDNAYMLTLPDGIAPWSGMFLWEPINDAFEGKCRDGDFDAGVIQHEYSHGLSNRYVGTEDGALGGHQSGSMGEGWGDWYGLDYLHREGLQTTSELGAYATGNTFRAIRNWPYDQNPTTFGDIGYDLTGPEVHADGEIWTATLWQLRKALVAKYGQALGSEIAARAVTDAMPLSPNDPSMLDVRDAMIVALDNRYHSRPDAGELIDLVYTAFAQRGMGTSASNHTTDDDPTGANDIDPVPGFEHRNPALNGSLNGVVLNASTGKPVAGAKVILGMFEAKVSPAAKTGPAGAFAVPAVAGTYPVTIQAPGFGAQTFTGLQVKAGGTTAKKFVLAPNLASAANGASIVSTTNPDGAKPLIDDTEGTTFSAAAGTGNAVVKLAQPAAISAVQVSAYTSSRFEALKSFTLQTSNDGVNWTTVPAFGKNAFSYQAPRPVLPDVHYKTFTLAKPVTASYLRFWTDEAMGDTKTNVQTGDLQVFSGTVKQVEPLPPTPPDAPVTETFTIKAGEPANVVDPGVTGTEFVNTCMAPPASQDVDGHVTTLSGESGDGAHAISVKGSGIGTWDLDVYFYSSSCQLLGQVATAAPDETGVIPSNAKYVVTHLYLGAALPVTLTITDTQ